MIMFVVPGRPTGTPAVTTNGVPALHAPRRERGAERSIDQFIRRRPALVQQTSASRRWVSAGSVGTRIAHRGRYWATRRAVPPDCVQESIAAAAMSAARVEAARATASGNGPPVSDRNIQASKGKLDFQ